MASKNLRKRRPRRQVKLTAPRVKPKKAAPKLQKSRQRDLRQAWSYLRRLGLIKSKRDARKIKKGDKIAAKQVARFRDVVAGRKRVFKVSKKAAKSYKRAGYETVGQTIIIHKKKGVRIQKKRKSDLIFQREKIDGGEIIIVLTPYSYSDLQDGLDKLGKDKEIQQLIKKGWRFAIRYFGYFSYEVFSDVNRLREYLEHYNSIQEGKVIRNLELIIVLVGKQTVIPREKPNRKSYKRRKRNYSKEWRTLKRNPIRYAKFKRDKRNQMRKLRRKGKKK